MLSIIYWNFSPEIFTLRLGEFALPITWYGLCFAIALLLGQKIVYTIFKAEGKKSSDVDALTIYAVVAIIAGARLGHYIFYEWETLLSTPATWLINLITPPFSGLASHGATIAFPIALYLYSRRRPDQSFLWITDRVVIGVALGGALIRFGNLLNSEIYGHPTFLPWGFVFERETNPALLPLVPRHPTQLYEALFCLFLFALTFYLWRTRRAVLPNGVISGTFILLLFLFRFLVEFLKNDQVAFENEMLLNMGQILSIPAMLFGLAILIIAIAPKRKFEAENPG